MNAKSSGATADFTITSNDAGGKDILGKLGLVAAYDTTSNEYKEYQLWASYKTDLTARWALTLSLSFSS